MTRVAVKFALIFAGLLWHALPAMAQGFPGCSPAQQDIVGSALDHAKSLTLKAAGAIGDTPEYTRWFGDYSPRNAEKVRANLKAVVSAIKGGGVTVQCELRRTSGCNRREYAWVYPGQAYVLHVCPLFFDLPPLAALQPGTRRSDNGTREGTIVHELSHFTRIADTEDHCYSRSECRHMALRAPLRAIDNADSYQYFTEDVTYYARQPLADKPAPASRSR